MKPKKSPDKELKLHPQGPLDHSRSATHCACSSANCSSRGAAHRRRHLTEVPAALTPYRVGEVRVVEEIEEVRTESQMDSFGAQGESLGNSKIVVGQAGAVVLVASRGAISPGRRSAGEVRLIERCVRIPVILMQRSGSDDVRPVIELVEAAEVLRTVKHRERCASLKRGDARDLPTAKNLSVHTVVPAQQAMARSDRQLDHVHEHCSMPNVKR